MVVPIYMVNLDLTSLPIIIPTGNALKLNAARQEYPDAFFTCSYDGRVNEDIFLWWFRDHFLKKVPANPNRPGICFISRGVHDITMQYVLKKPSYFLSQSA